MSRLDRLLNLLETGSTPAKRAAAAVQIGEIQRNSPEGLSQALLQRLYPLLSDQNWDTRIAASRAIESIVSALGQLAPRGWELEEFSEEDLLQMSDLEIGAILAEGKPLLASGGDEYDVVISKKSLRKQKEHLRQFLADSELTSNRYHDDTAGGIIADADLLPSKSESKPVKMDIDKDKDESSKSASTSASSARMKRFAKLKRKLKPVKVASSKRKAGTGAGASAGAFTSAVDSGSGKGQGSSSTLNLSWKCGIDVSIASKEKEKEMWPFYGLILDVSADLWAPNWEQRHGAAMVVRDVIKVHGLSAPVCLLEDLLVRLLYVLALDRFSDFVSDQAIAPVRETCAQGIGVILSKMKSEFVRDSIEQISVFGKQLNWEVRHAGLLCLKYIVAASATTMISEVLNDAVVPSVLVGLGDSDGDVKAVSADTLAPVIDRIATLPSDILSVLVSALWSCLNNIVAGKGKEGEGVGEGTGRSMNVSDLIAAVRSILNILSSIYSFHDTTAAPSSTSTSVSTSSSIRTAMPVLENAVSLFPFLQHDTVAIRVSSIKTLGSLLRSNEWIQYIDAASSQSITKLVLLFRHLYQCTMLESNDEVLNHAVETWRVLVTSVKQPLLVNICKPILPSFFVLASKPVGSDIDDSLIIGSISSLPGGEQKSEGKGEGEGDARAAKRIKTSSPSPFSTRWKKCCDEFVSSRMIGILAYCWPVHDLQVWTNELDRLFSSSFASARIVGNLIVSSWISLLGITTDHDHEHVAEVEAEAEGNWIAEKLNLILSTYIASGSSAMSIYWELASSVDLARQQCMYLVNCLSPSTLSIRLADIEKLLCVPLESTSVEGIQFIVDQLFPRWCSSSLATVTVTVEEGKEKEVVNHIEGGEIPPHSEVLKREIRGTLAYISNTNESWRRKVAASAAVTLIDLCSLKPFESEDPINANSLIFRAKMPASLNAVIRPMTAVLRTESMQSWQSFVSSAIPYLLSLCLNRSPSPNAQIVKNLSVLACSDRRIAALVDSTGALESALTVTMKTGKPGSDVLGQLLLEAATSSSTVEQQHLNSRRGGETALKSIAAVFGEKVFDKVPSLWTMISKENDGSQLYLDGLHVLETLADSLAIHTEIKNRIIQLLPSVFNGLLCELPSIRTAAAKALASLGIKFGVLLMEHVVDVLIPKLSEVSEATVCSRRGVIELLFYLIEGLDLSLLPYLVLLVPPILGRMSDPDSLVRRTSARCFGSLMRLMPLEAGAQNPKEMSEKMQNRRAHERHFLDQLLDSSKLQRSTIPVKVNVDLRSYQYEGVSWLDFLRKYALHGALCDDMGLGKTLMTLVVIATDVHERKASGIGKMKMLDSLIVCPPTLVGHWVNEAKKYLGDALMPIAFLGSQSEKKVLRNKITARDKAMPHLVIMSYGSCREEIEKGSSLSVNLNWSFCVLDEGHIIKNPKAGMTKAVKRINAAHRLILTGTPIQNNVLELWSLFDFLMPGLLGTQQQFNVKYSKPVIASRNDKASDSDREAGTMALEALHRQVLPFIMRRLKEDVLKDLPPKLIFDRECELSWVQKALYEQDDQIKQEVTELSSSGEIENEKEKAKSKTVGRHVFQSLQYLKRLCSHPRLVLDSHPKRDEIMDKLKQRKMDLRDPEVSPKLMMLRQILEECGIGSGSSENGAGVGQGQGQGQGGELEFSSSATAQHRALIFCQIRNMVDIVVEDLFKAHMPGVAYLRLDGTVDASSRDSVVQQFNSDPTIDCLILTTRVGGLGLNLTGADTVIFLEHDWNPMKDLQAMDRAHRLGQKRKVTVYRIITKGTIEEKIMNLQNFKKQMAETVVNTENASLRTMDTQGLLDLFATTPSSSATQGQQNAIERAGAGGLPKGVKEMLDSVQELWDEDQYADEFDVKNFYQK